MIRKIRLFIWRSVVKCACAEMVFSFNYIVFNRTLFLVSWSDTWTLLFYTQTSDKEVETFELQNMRRLSVVPNFSFVVEVFKVKSQNSNWSFGRTGPWLIVNTCALACDTPQSVLALTKETVGFSNCKLVKNIIQLRRKKYFEVINCTWHFTLTLSKSVQSTTLQTSIYYDTDLLEKYRVFSM